MSDIKYQIIKKIGVLSKSASGWAKDLNLVSWNEREPKYDLRDWSPDGAKMGKGVTLSKYDLSKMTILPKGRFDPKRRIGNNIIVLESDVAKAFPNDETVNEALRLLLKASQLSKRVPA